MTNTEVRAHEWVGNLPDSWETMPLRALMEPQTEKNVGALNQDYLSLMANVGVIPYADKGEIGNKAPEDLSKCKLVNRGDFVLNSMNFGIGSFGVSNFDGVCSSVYVVLKPKQDSGVPEFLKYIFSMRPFQKHVQSLGNGILEHRAAIGWDDLKNMHCPVPPVSEQKAIAEFLDRETAQIDNLIAKQEQLVNGLLERRLALITSIITRGLGANGLQIPGVSRSSWLDARLRYQVEVNPSKTSAISLADELEVSFVPMNLIGDEGSIDLETVRPYGELVGSYSYFAAGDVLMAKVTPCFENGKGAVAPQPIGGCGFATTEVTVLRPKSTLDPEFLYFLLHTDGFLAGGKAAMTGAGGLKRVPDAFVKNFKFQLPPVEQQRELIFELKKQLTSIERLQKGASRAVELLKERRQALISAAVTGKIDVRG